MLVVLIPIRWTLMPDSRHVDNAGLSSLDKESQSVSTDDRTPVPDSCLQACNAARLGIRSLCTLVCGVGWNPALFTCSLDECASKVGSTFGNYKHHDRRILIETAAFNELLATLEETADFITKFNCVAGRPCTIIGRRPPQLVPASPQTIRRKRKQRPPVGAQRPRRGARGAWQPRQRAAVQCGRREAGRAAAATATAAAPRPRRGVTGGRRRRQRPSLCVINRPCTVTGHASATPAQRMAQAQLSAYQPA